jgi:hypothetical protein
MASHRPSSAATDAEVAFAGGLCPFQWPLIGHHPLQLSVGMSIAKSATPPRFRESGFGELGPKLARLSSKARQEQHFCRCPPPVL